MSQFRITHECEAGQWIRYRNVSCKCGAEGRVKDNGHRPLAVSPTKAAFRRIGWTSVEPDRGVCPSCSAQAPKAITAKEKPMAAEPPRQPTIEDKRRIREALFAQYLEEKDCYAKAHSDKSVAASLTVPAAWVANAREALGFGPDANEASTAFSSEVIAIRKDLTKLQDELLAVISSKSADLEKRLNEVERGGYRGAA